MKVKLSAFCALYACIFLIATPISAHHGGSSYDIKKLTTLKGTVTEFQFVNPHSELFFDVTDASGKVQKWVAEAVSVASLSRYGWTKNTFKPGDQVTITGNLAKNGSLTMRLKKVVLPSGKVLSVEVADDYADQ